MERLTRDQFFVGKVSARLPFMRQSYLKRGVGDCNPRCLFETMQNCLASVGNKKNGTKTFIAPGLKSAQGQHAQQ